MTIFQTIERENKMLSITHTGSISKWVKGEGLKKLTEDDITEKEILLAIAAKLHSIRGMLIFFTFITILGIFVSVIAIVVSSRS